MEVLAQCIGLFHPWFVVFIMFKGYLLTLLLQGMSNILSRSVFFNFRSRDALCSDVDVSGTTGVRTRRVRTDTKQKLRRNPAIKLSKTCSTGIHKSCIPVTQGLDC